MSRPRPSAKALFALYHLGVDEEGEYAFRNALDISRIYNQTPDIILNWTREGGFDPDTVGHVDFNLSRRHVDAQFAEPEQLQAIIDEAWAGYQEALKSADPEQFFHDHDYDKL